MGYNLNNTIGILEIIIKRIILFILILPVNTKQVELNVQHQHNINLNS